MTNAKHTPGPWSYKAGDSILYIQSKGIIAKVGIAGYWEKYSPEDEANARLIAAAPEMLVALKACKMLLDDLEAQLQTKFATTIIVDSAITQAEGRK